MYIFINCIGIIITTPPAISKAYKNNTSKGFHHSFIIFFKLPPPQ